MSELQLETSCLTGWENPTSADLKRLRSTSTNLVLDEMNSEIACYNRNLGSHRVKHETKVYRGEEALAYAKRNEGAYLHIDDLVAKTEAYDRSLDLEEDADKIDALVGAKYGPDVFYIEGGVSDAHDEAFFCWLLRAYDHVRSRLFSTDFSGSYFASFDDENPEDIGVDFDLIDWDKHTAVSSVTLECIGLRLAREGKLRALEAGDSYEFIWRAKGSCGH